MHIFATFLTSRNKQVRTGFYQGLIFLSNGESCGSAQDNNMKVMGKESEMLCSDEDVLCGLQQSTE